jgi:hypothetical protein
MTTFPPDPEERDLVAVKSVARPDGGRRFALEEGLGEEAAGLRELLGAQRHESDLVSAMREVGFHLTMIGGGASPEETRRFYFRKVGGSAEGS